MKEEVDKKKKEEEAEQKKKNDELKKEVEEAKRQTVVEVEMIDEPIQKPVIEVVPVPVQEQVEVIDEDAQRLIELKQKLEAMERENTI